MKLLGVEACGCSGKYIFISYAHDDSALVSQIVQKLYYRGIRIWYDAGIPEGENWVKCLTKALDGCAVVVSFLSKSFVSSDYCYSELALAKRQHRVNIPVLIEEVELTEEIRFVVASSHYINQYLYLTVDQIVENLFSLINKAYSGKLTNSQISSMQMRENIDALIQHENWYYARKEAGLMTKEDSEDYMSWYCQFRVFTRDKALVSCVSDNNSLIGYSLNSMDRNIVSNSYREAYRLSAHDDSERQKIHDSFLLYRDHYDQVNHGITTVNRTGNEYFELQKATEETLSNNETDKRTLFGYFRSIVLYFITSMIESFVFLGFVSSVNHTSSRNNDSSVLNISNIISLLVIFVIIISIVTLVIAISLAAAGDKDKESSDESMDNLHFYLKLFKFTFSPITLIRYIYILIRSLCVNRFVCNPLKDRLEKTRKEYEELKAATLRELESIIYFVSL